MEIKWKLIKWQWKLAKLESAKQPITLQVHP